MILSQNVIGRIAGELVRQGAVSTVLTGPKYEDEAVAQRAARYLRNELEREGVEVQRRRRAIIQFSKYPNSSLETVQNYLPSNFEARLVKDTGDGECILIEGYDDHGWTLDDYVIPRLASGLIVAKEVS